MSAETLVELAGNVAGLDGNDLAYLEAVPPALREGIRAAIASAIRADKAVHVGFSPGYDFEVRLNDYEKGSASISPARIRRPSPETHT